MGRMSQKLCPPAKSMVVPYLPSLPLCPTTMRDHKAQQYGGERTLLYKEKI